MTRQKKTPRQRAQEQLDAAKRAAEKLVRQRNAAQAEHERLSHEVAAAIARRDYLAQHPDLTHPTSTTDQAGATA